MTSNVVYGPTTVAVASHQTGRAVFDFFEAARREHPSKLSERDERERADCLRHRNLSYSANPWGGVLSCSAVIQCESDDRWVEIGMTAVSKNAQTQGIGTLHVARGMFAAYANNQRAFCGVEDNNHRVFRMLGGLGWQICDQLPKSVSVSCRQSVPARRFTTLLAPPGTEILAARVMKAAINNPRFRLEDPLFHNEYRDEIMSLLHKNAVG